MAEPSRLPAADEVLEKAPTGLAVLDGLGRIRWVNRRLARMLRQDAGELVDRWFGELVHPEDHDIDSLEPATLAIGETRDRGRRRYLRPDGTVAWGGLAVARLPDGPDGPRLVVHVVDLSDLVRAEERLGLVIAGLDDGVLTLDPRAAVATANPAALRLLERPGLPLVGSGLRDPENGVVDADGQELAPEARPELVALATGELASGLLGLSHPDGDTRWVSVTAHPIERSNGERWIVASYKDESERRRVEAARASAEEADRAKSEFLSRMSHELRTPLNAVLGFAQLLHMDGLDEGQQESVDQILAAGRHLLGLLDEVLDLERIETGRLEVRLESLSIGGALQEAVELVQPLAAASGVAVDLRVGRLADRRVLADAQRLRQVLLNLLTNAIKYNRARGRVTVSAQDDGTTVVVRVADTGLGLAPDELERVFTPFERLGADRMGIEGAGVGLALAKRLTEAMGGLIGAESTPGRGSTFWVALRVTGAESHREPGTVSPDAVAAVLERTARAPRRVLYIEDNEASRRLVSQLTAKHAGLELVTAVDAADGLALALRTHPHAVLLDLNLPDRPGEEVLRVLRATPGTAETPVIVVSADATASRQEQLAAQGAVAYITKPIDVSALFTALEVALGAGAP